MFLLCFFLLFNVSFGCGFLFLRVEAYVAPSLFVFFVFGWCIVVSLGCFGRLRFGVYWLPVDWLPLYKCCDHQLHKL